MVLTTLFAGLFLAGTGIAQASILQFQDGFEVSPASVWHISVGGDGNAGFEIAKGTARSGANNGWVYASNGWASEGIWVPTGAAAVHRDAQCIAQIWVESVGVASVTYEVRDAEGNLIDGGGAQLPPLTWVPVTSPYWWLNGRPQVFVRLILTNFSGQPALVRLDDFTLQCTWQGP